MTSTPEQDDRDQTAEPLSLLPAGDTRVRVLPAELARIFGVSRQTVSRWVKNGKVTLHADGRVNPSEAARQILARSDPRRLRARLLKPLLDDVGSLREQLGSLRDQLEGEGARADKAERELEKAKASEGFFMALADNLDVIVGEREAELRATNGSDEWRELLDQLYEEASERAEKAPSDLDGMESAALGRAFEYCEEGDSDGPI
ncbi:MAG: hypothetical protein HUJ28_09320 [Chromatiales bacterium]|nr:hypothetical protein [Chromatiales bacterium]